MNIRSKLILYIGGTLTVILTLSFSTLLVLSSNQIKKDLEINILNQRDNITKQVSDLIYTSAKSYLMAVGKSSLMVAKDKRGLSDSKVEVLDKLINIRFLNTGYIYLTDSLGRIIAHPNKKLVGTISPLLSWIQRLKPEDEKFKEFEENGKSKIVFRIYDKDLDINLCVTADRSDFINTVDIDELNITMNHIQVGKTGYPFLLESNGEILTHPHKRLLIENGKEIITRIISEKNGYFEYQWEEIDGSIRDKYVQFKYEKNSEVIVAVTGYVDEIYEYLNQQKKMIIIIGLIVLLVVILIITLVSSTVTTQMGLFSSKLADISQGEGDLTKRIILKSSDEIGVMGGHFNNFLDSLQNIINNIKHSSTKSYDIKNKILYNVEETSSAVEEISASIRSINRQTDYLFTNVDSSAISVNEINSNILDLNSSITEQSVMIQSSNVAITQMISLIFEVSKITNLRQETVNELILRAKEGDDIINKTLLAVSDVSSKLSNIKSIAEVILNIASQTNLLSMNAAIEAAHAGVYGKGFAVVADEIRKLADSSRENSSKITTTLNEVGKSMDFANELTIKTRESFTLVYNEINEIVGALKDISGSTSELKISGNDILESINGLDIQSNVVKEKISSISRESGDVKKAMDNTKDIATELVSSINEIDSGIGDITESMVRHRETTVELEESGEALSKHINKFVS